MALKSILGMRVQLLKSRSKGHANPARRTPCSALLIRVQKKKRKKTQKQINWRLQQAQRRQEYTSVGVCVRVCGYVRVCVCVLIM